MNQKLKIYLLNYTPIGNTARNNVWFKAKCQTTKRVFKSPVFNQCSPTFNQTSQSVWEFELFQSQTDLFIQMITLDSIKKTQQIISQVILSKLHQLQDEAQAMFYLGKQRIGALSFRIKRQKIQKPVINETKAEERLTQQIHKAQNKTKMKLQFDQSQEDSENQRYDVQFTPHETINNSVVKLAKVQDHSYFHIFKGFDESSIEQREPFSRDQSFQIPDGIKSRAKVPHQYESERFANKKSQIKQNDKLRYLEPGLITSNSLISKPNPLKDHKSKEQSRANEKIKFKEEQEQSDNQIRDALPSKYRFQKQPSSLQKWLQKLQKFQKQKQKQTPRGPQYECIISQKIKQEKSKDFQKQANITLSLLNINLDSTVDDSYCLKSLKMKVIDERNKKLSGQQLFECKFSLLNQNDYQDKWKQIRLNKLKTQIPSDTNVEVEISLENLDQSEPQEVKISGILMKDKLIETDQIPLFDQDENLFASLIYKAKKIINVSVQYLQPLNSLTQAEQLQKSKLNSSKDHHKEAKKLIRQRKINKMQRKEILIDNQSPRNNIDLIRSKPLKQTVLNSTVRGNVQKDFFYERMNLSPDSQPKKRKDSTFSTQLERSNTDNGPNMRDYSKQQSEVDKQSKSSRSPSIKQLKAKIMKINQEMSQFTGNVSLPVSPHKHHPQRLRLKSTTLADLREEQSQDQEDDDHRIAKFQVSQKAESDKGYQMPLFSPKKYSILKKLRTEPDRTIQPGERETIHHRNDLGKFIIEINAITVVLYEHQKPEEQENGKFIILKSQTGETFITDTLFSSHLNLNWKNKFYQFTSSQIQIGIYQKSGFSSQSQSKLMGKVQVKLVHLMKAIKQNFHRAEIFMNHKPIGIVILIYDILLQKQFAMYIHEERRNNSEMKIKNYTQKVTSLTRQTQHQKYYIRGSEKSTIKVGKEKNRKRAKTLQPNKKSYHLPVIDRISNPSRRRPYNYEGGKNITIGRAERFINTNMAQVVGEL